MNILRLALLPFSFLYGVVTWLRNRFYDWKWLTSNSSTKSFTVVVGNLEVGGTGKTPMIEFLVRRCLENGVRVATLSRGYGRKTKGFLWVDIDSSSDSVGDEPLQFKKKFPDIGVAVCENRWYGVQQLEENFDLILLDDAFQHRAFVPHFSILLFNFNSIFKPKFLLPAGNFRDHWRERKRADIWMVTKCPSILDTQALNKIKSKLKGTGPIAESWDQPLFFSGIEYMEAVSGTDPSAFLDLNSTDINSAVLVTGIAQPLPLLEYLKDRFTEVRHIKFPDHHNFSAEDFDRIKNDFEAMPGRKKILITTEKDAQRIQSSAPAEFLVLPWFFLPIRAVFQKPQDADTVYRHIMGRYESFIRSN